MINLTDVKIAVTHSERFHADDVFVGAMLKKLLPDVKIVRSRDPNVIAKANLVFDVGGEHDEARLRFDHHQIGSLERKNGIPYSAFGLLWRRFGVDYCDGSKQLADKVDQKLVQIIDADDNGVSLVESRGSFSLSTIGLPDIIGQLNPLDGSKESYDDQYVKAVDLADTVLRRFVEIENSLLVSSSKVIESYDNALDKRLIVLSETLSFHDAADKLSGLLYVVMPYSRSSKWAVLATRETASSFEARKPLPDSWAGLRDQELVEATGVSDALFCHKKRFLVIAQTRDGALALAKQALEA